MDFFRAGANVSFHFFFISLQRKKEKKRLEKENAPEENSPVSCTDFIFAVNDNKKLFVRLC